MRGWLEKHSILKGGKQGYFGKLLIFGLLIMAVPVLLLGSIWYEMGRNAEEKEALSQEQRHMDLISREVSNLISNVEQELIYLKYGTILKTYQLNRTPTSTMDLINEMAKIKSMHNAISDVYFYDENREWIYTTSGFAVAIEDFYDTDWLNTLQNSISIQHLEVRSCLGETFAKQIHGKRLENFYPDQQVLSIVSNGSHGAYFVVNLDVGSITEELYRKYVADGRDFYLADGQGKILSGCGPSVEDLDSGVISGFSASTGEATWWNADRHLYYVRLSGYENIYCVEKIPHALVYENVEQNRLLILVLIVLVTLSTAVLCSFMAKKLYQPIGDLYQTMRKDSAAAMTSGDEIMVITRTVRDLNRLQEDNAQKIARQREQLQSEMLRLLLNRMIGKEDFLRETQLDKKEESGWHFLVCRMDQKGGIPETESGRIHLKEVLNTYLTAKERGIFTEYQYGVYVALYQADASNAHVMYEVLDSMIEEQLYCSMSEEFRLTDSLLEHFAKMDQEARDRQFFGNEWRADAEGESTEISVTNYEAGLIRGILLENPQAIAEDMLRLRKDFVGLQSHDKVLEIAQRIFITVDKECRNKEDADGINAVAMQLQKCENLTELIELLHQEFMQMCNSLKTAGGSENEYYTKACAYIQENYFKNMNILDVADHLGISYAYLSKIFKEHSENGEKLLDYLNRIRIEKAKQLLSETDISLTEIAERVGYNNAQSLQRFFKKYETVTPGEWRRMQGKKQASDYR